MGTIAFRQLWDRDIIEAVQELLTESGNLKREIFRAAVANESVDKKVVTRYVSYINNVLMNWESFTTDLQKKMKDSKGKENVETINYRAVKDFIYSSYEYPAVLRFVDNIIKGIEDNKLKEPEDIEELFKKGTSIAFEDRGDSVASLLNSVMVNEEGDLHNEVIKTDGKESSMYNSVKSYNKLFNSNDRSVIYKAVTKTIEFLSSREMCKKYLNSDNMRLFVSIVNNTVEFMSYTIAAYMTRIYAIQRYAYPFIYSSTMMESVELPSDGSRIDDYEVVVMRNADEAKFKIRDNIKDLINTFNEFTGAIGGSAYFGNDKPGTNYCMRSGSRNQFCDKMISNPLYDMISKGGRDFISYNLLDRRGIKEMHQILKSAVYSQQQAIQGISTPRQEILHIIRGVKPGDTTKGCQELAADLSRCVAHICTGIDVVISEIRHQLVANYNDPRAISSLNNDGEECAKMLDELYGDLVSAFIQKGRDIEALYNNLHMKDIDKVVDKTSLDINVSTTNVTNAVPDTTRIPMEIMDMYSLPAFESMEMYDDFLRSLPMFESDAYFVEAGGPSALINKVYSFIQNAFRRWTAMYGDKKFQEALNYVNTQEAELRSMTIPNGSQMTVLPYKDNINISGTIFSNVTNGLKNFKPEILNNKDGIQNFVKSLYPDEKVYSWFNPQNENSQDNAKTAKIKLVNYILFTKDGQDAPATDTKKVTINGSQIKEYLPKWIGTIKGVTSLNEGMVKLNEEMNNAFKSFKEQIVSATNNENNKQDSAQQATDNAGSASEIAKAAENGKKDEKIEKVSGEVVNNDGSPAKLESFFIEAASSNPAYDILLTEVYLVLNRVVTPTVWYIVSCIRNSYAYIQQAYKLGHGADNNQNTQNNQNQ